MRGPGPPATGRPLGEEGTGKVGCGLGLRAHAGPGAAPTSPHASGSPARPFALMASLRPGPSSFRTAVSAPSQLLRDGRVPQGPFVLRLHSVSVQVGAVSWCQRGCLSPAWLCYNVIVT